MTLLRIHSKREGRRKKEKQTAIEEQLR